MRAALTLGMYKVALAAFAMAATPALADEETVPSKLASPGIYERIELGFKLCANHVLQRGHLAKQHTEFLAGMNVELVDTVPDDVLQSSAPVFPRDRVYARLNGENADVHIITAKGHYACRVIISETDDAIRHRINFVDALRKTSAWTYDERRSGMRGQMLWEELTTANGQMVAIMNGPNTVLDGGKGVQGLLTVGLIPPTAKRVK